MLCSDFQFFLKIKEKKFGEFVSIFLRGIAEEKIANFD